MTNQTHGRGLDPGIQKDLKEIRTNSPLYQTMQKYPQIRQWVKKPYTEQEVSKAISHLKNRKSHGIDGIPGEAYKALGKWITKPLTNILNKIHAGEPLPPDWLNGAVVHIYKNKGDAHECKNYQPICLTQIIYKIWPILITRNLIQILHLMTGIQQYGYKQGLSTLGAIQKIENYAQEGGKDSQILLMDLSKAFDRINRTQLWATLYKKGLPEKTTLQIREGRKNTQLCTKYQGKYGELQENNIGVFQGSAISALLFIIYLDDVMEDYAAINQKEKLPTRLTLQRDPNAETQRILQNIKQQSQTKTTNTTEETKQGQITNKKTRQTEAKTKIQAEDHAIYADDTNLYLHQETQAQTITRLEHYPIMTHTRNMIIQWTKAHLMTRKRKKQTQEQLPYPYNQIQASNKGAVLGEIIHMQQSQNQAVKHRLRKAQQAWSQTRRKLFQNHAIPEKLRIMIWNAIVRATLTYAL